MATLKVPRRSVSPFGLKEPELSPFAVLEKLFAESVGSPPPQNKPVLSSFSDACHIPSFVEKISRAAANDAPDLSLLCQFLIHHAVDLESKNLSAAVFRAMEELFKLKTEVFLVDHQTKETLEKLGLAGDHRDVVLFARERNILIGQYFAPATETNPGLFSELITRWVETENRDRLLHFLDFAAGATDPTFECYLVFAHPALQRIVTNKNHLRALVKKVEPLLKKISSPTWEKRVRQTLDV